MSIHVSKDASAAADPLALLEEKSALFRSAEEVVNRHYLGQKDMVHKVMLGIIAGNHVLLEAPPGTGKTHLSKTIGKVFGLHTTRIQFTPDLLPMDVIGGDAMKMDANGNRTYGLQEGPIFHGTQLLHADEANRASTRTQSAFLEAMQERAVTFVGYGRRELTPLFTVVATQNPENEREGTMPMPSANLDRFSMCIHVPPLDLNGIKAVMNMRAQGEKEVEAVTSAEDLSQVREVLQHIVIPDHVQNYIAEVQYAASNKDFADKVSPTLTKAFHYEKDVMGNPTRDGARCAISLMQLGRASAFLRGSTVVEIKDVQPLVSPVLIHRLGSPRYNAEVSAKDALDNLSRDLLPG